MMFNLHATIGYPLFLAAVLELLLGYLLLRQNPRNNPENNAAAVIAFFSSAFALSTAVMYTRASLDLSYNLFARLSWIGWFCIPAALQFLYSQENPAGKTARYIGFALYPFWTAVFLLTLFTDLVVSDVYELIPFRNEPGPLEKPLRLFASLLLFWITVKTIALRRRSSGIARRKLNLFLWGLLVFGGGAAITAGILQLVRGVPLEPALASYFSLPWVAMTYYAIAKYQLFNIRLILSRTIALLLLLILLAILQTGLFLLLEPVLGHGLSIFISLAFLGFPVFGARLSGGIERWVESIMMIRDGGPDQELLRTATHRLSSLLLLDELLEQLTTLLCTGLQVREARVYLAGADGLRAAQPAARGTVDLLPPDLTRRLEKTGLPVIRTVEQSLLPDEDADRIITALRAVQCEIALPLVTQGKLIGAITLSPRSSGPYSQADLLVLETLAAQAAAAIVNSTLFQETVRIKDFLRESEERFRALAETAPAAIIIHQGGPFLYVNRTAERLFNRGRDLLLQSSLWDLAHPEDREAVRSRSLRNLSGNEMVPAWEFRISAGVAGPRWVIGSAGLMDFHGKRAEVVTLIDVTDRRHLQDKLRYLQKMETIGKLAGGIAHDFNNILTAIVGQADFLQMELPQDHPLRANAEKILSATERASALVQRLLSYGSRKNPTLFPGEVNELLQSQEHFLAETLPASVRLVLEPSTQPLSAMMDRGQMERVLLNLVVNARDAMPDGGTITLSSGVTEIDAAFIENQGFGKQGTYAFFTVRDTGTGMDESVRKRVFEPFFTTKSAGKGTGFGLSIVYEIVKDHAGYIIVASTPGSGSCFTVYLPLIEVRRIPEEPLVPKDSGLVLIVDDDKITRLRLRIVLERHGFTVVEACDGVEALKEFQRIGDACRLVITDINMPNMNGRDLYAAIKALQPDSRFLFMSCYGEDILRKCGIHDKDLHFLLKPATPSDIIEMTRKALHS